MADSPSTRRIRVSVLVTALVLAVLAVGYGAAPVAAQSDEPTLDCVGSGGGAVYVTDSNLTVFENDSAIDFGTFPDGETVDFGEAALSASGPASVRLENGTGSVTCLGDVNASTHTVNVTADGEGTFLVDGEANGLSFREPVYAAGDGAADLAYDSPGALDLRLPASGLSAGTSVLAVDHDSGTTLDTATVAGNGTVAVSLPAGTNSVDVTVGDSPAVVSITRASPASPTNADNVTFDVTFSESVSGVDTGDFNATATSGNVTGNVTSVNSSSGSTVTVTVGDIAGDGEFRLDLVDDDSITDEDGLPLGGAGTSGNGDGSFTGGQTFTIDNTDPTADAGSDQTTDEDTVVHFDAAGSTDDIGVASYEWDFGDGTNATGTSANHSYVTPGTYAVNLTVTDTAGNIDTDTVTVTVRDTTAPTADAGPNKTAEVGTAVTLDGTQSSDNGDIVSYVWNFGNGTTASNATATPTYSTPGTYTVTLTVVDSAGNTDSDTVTVTVVENESHGPTAHAGDDREVETGVAVTFDGTNSTADGTIVSYEWDFGDGTDATGATVNHAFSTVGTYTVTLTVTDDAGNTDTDTLVVTVNASDDSDLFTEPLPNSGGDGPPTDPDGDGLYEDVDGDGQAVFSDAIAMAFVDTSELSPEQLDAVDFNGDGVVDFFDAVELAFAV
ncbi:MAG: PKD domain-containing protein [Halobacteriota archaeon]